MSYIVRDWMARPIIVIDDSTLVTQAMTLMRRRNIHSLVVDCSDARGKMTYGIVTTTDIRDKIVAAGRDPGKIAVSDIMTSPVHTAKPSWTLQECAEKMHKLNIRHMPVSDNEGMMVGMISQTDIFSAVEEAGWEALG